MIVDSNLPSVFTLKEIVARWSTNRKNVIKACLENNVFCAYISITKKTILHEHKLNIAHRDIDITPLQISTPYSYCGYAQLSKRTKIKEHFDLAYFYTNTQLTCAKKAPCIISVVPPSVKAECGIYQFIEVRCNILHCQTSGLTFLN